MAEGLYIGLMSGTSIDAVDAGLFFIGSDGAIETRGTLSHPWPEDLRQALKAVCPTTSVVTLGELDHRVAEVFASATQALLARENIPAKSIQAIGSHGQTVLHLPAHQPPLTFQIGDPNIIAQQTGITTVADFRRRDMAAGGQGAPLVPAFHEAVFQHPTQNRVVINIGGIANVTLLHHDKMQSVRGFDTGPGNVLMDAWIRSHLGLRFDANGEWAAQGKVDHALLDLLARDDYFAKAPPKSTGPEYFNLGWLQAYLSQRPSISPADVQATLCALSAHTIASAIQATLPDAEEWLVCGGGCRNSTLMAMLQQNLPAGRVATTDAAGIDADFVEAAAFAWLAYRTLQGLPSNLPAVTGARAPVVLGGIYPHSN